MFNSHITIGIIALAFTLVFLFAKYLRAEKRSRLPWWGWAGLATILSAEFLNSQHVMWVAIYFTPLAWTGYILLVDGLVASIKSESLLSGASRRFLALTICSVPLWLIFEAYNLRLQNWKYVGLPQNSVLRDFGYVWSFATIWPAVFETSDLVAALGIFRPKRSRHGWLGRGGALGLSFAGVVCLVVPVIAPPSIGRYLFGAVWLGFLLSLDPFNYRREGFSFFREFEKGETVSLWSFMGAGWICGILWEFWNYWAGAKWVYIFPIGQGWKVFEMPLAGYLGFLPFALECKVMFEFLQTLKTRMRSERPMPAWGGPLASRHDRGLAR